MSIVYIMSSSQASRQWQGRVNNGPATRTRAMDPTCTPELILRLPTPLFYLGVTDAKLTRQVYRRSKNHMRSIWGHPVPRLPHAHCHEHKPTKTLKSHSATFILPMRDRSHGAHTLTTVITKYQGRLTRMSQEVIQKGLKAFAIDESLTLVPGIQGRAKRGKEMRIKTTKT